MTHFEEKKIVTQFKSCNQTDKANDDSEDFYYHIFLMRIRKGVGMEGSHLKYNAFY